MILAAVIALAGLSVAQAAAPEQFAVYNVCKDRVGTVTYSNRSADGAFLVRCPGETEPRIVIKGCRGSVAYDASYNVVVSCADGRKVPIIRGPYPR